jgi:hypothetical protein
MDSIATRIKDQEVKRKSNVQLAASISGLKKMCAYITFPISQNTDIIFPLLFCSSTIICVLVMTPFKPEFNGEFQIVVCQGVNDTNPPHNSQPSAQPLGHTIGHDPSQRPRIALRLCLTNMLVFFDCVLWLAIMYINPMFSRLECITSRLLGLESVHTTSHPCRFRIRPAIRPVFELLRLLLAIPYYSCPVCVFPLGRLTPSYTRT